jgi:hypothetical protein
MAIYRLLQYSPLSPEDIRVLTDAYEAVLRSLDIVERSDPVTLLIAKKIIETGQTGLREPMQICELVVKSSGRSKRLSA